MICRADVSARAAVVVVFGEVGFAAGGIVAVGGVAGGEAWFADAAPVTITVCVVTAGVAARTAGMFKHLLISRVRILSIYCVQVTALPIIQLWLVDI